MYITKYHDLDKKKRTALAVVLDKLQDLYPGLKSGKTDIKELNKKYFLMMSKPLIQRAILESRTTMIHPKTGKVQAVSQIDCKKVFGFDVIPSVELTETIKLIPKIGQ